LDWIIDCLTVQHDWRLTLLAAAVCLTAMATSITLLRMAIASAGRRRFTISAMAGFLGGLGVWATHFIGMLGHNVTGRVYYTVGETMASLGIVIVGLILGTTLALAGTARLTRALVALVAASSVAAMHFVGMAAVRIEGAALTWSVAGAAFLAERAASDSLQHAIRARLTNDVARARRQRWQWATWGVGLGVVAGLLLR
jgi:NO-binding membrane sensor protein with MHYT domain